MTNMSYVFFLLFGAPIIALVAGGVLLGMTYEFYPEQSTLLIDMEHFLELTGPLFLSAGIMGVYLSYLMLAKALPLSGVGVAMGLLAAGGSIPFVAVMQLLYPATEEFQSQGMGLTMICYAAIIWTSIASKGVGALFQFWMSRKEVTA